MQCVSHFRLGAGAKTLWSWLMTKIKLLFRKGLTGLLDMGQFSCQGTVNKQGLSCQIIKFWTEGGFAHNCANCSFFAVKWLTMLLTFLFCWVTCMIVTYVYFFFKKWIWGHVQRRNHSSCIKSILLSLSSLSYFWKLIKKR